MCTRGGQSHQLLRAKWKLLANFLLVYLAAERVSTLCTVLYSKHYVPVRYGTVYQPAGPYLFSQRIFRISEYYHIFLGKSEYRDILYNSPRVFRISKHSILRGYSEYRNIVFLEDVPNIRTCFSKRIFRISKHSILKGYS